MNDNDLVSIILPVYNVQSYIEECVKSIINLKYKNFEAIFIDDGSTDNCYNILMNFSKQDKRIKVLHKNNGGVSSAKNLGLKKAKGKYITFVDPDDYVTPDYIDNLLDLIKKNNAEITVSKGILDNYKMKPDKYNIQFYEDVFMGEGFNFNVKCFSCANKVAVGFHKTYFYRRDNNNSATTKFKIEKWENAIYAVDKMKENLDFKDIDIENAWKFARWRTNVDGYTLLCITNNQKN